MRITNVWNSLPFSVVTARTVRSVNSFKTRLINTGRHKNLDMIGKQNYQEIIRKPGNRSRVEFWVLL